MDVGIGEEMDKAISQVLISLNLTPVDVEDRDDWRRTRVADQGLEKT